MRTRTTDLPESKVTYSYYQGFGLHEPEDHNITRNLVQSYETVVSSGRKVVQDVNNPGFYKRRRNGELIVNPFSIVKDTTELGSFTSMFRTYDSDGKNIYFEERENINSSIIQGIWGGRPWLSAYVSESDFSDLGNNRDLAITDVWAKRDSPEFALANVLAEGDETLKFLAGLLYAYHNPIKTLKKGLKHLKYKYKNLSSIPWNSTKDLADLWLTFQFSVMPIAYDIKDFIEADLQETLMKRQTYRSRSEQSLVMTREDGDDWYRASHVSTLHTSVTGGLTVDYVYDSKIQYYKQILGFNDPLALAWELTRLSWLLDYFVNIGKVIQSHSPDVAIVQQAGWLSTKTVIQGIVQVNGGNLVLRPDGSRSIADPCSAQNIVTREIFSREKLPLPSWLPTLTVNKLHWSQTTNVIAILRNSLTTSS